MQWNPQGAAADELVFVSGHPGRTDRLNTMDALKFQRDVRAPYVLNMLRRMEIMLQQYSQDGEEQARIAKEDLFGVQNSRKAYLGQLGGLQDPGIMARKGAAEKALRDRVNADPRMKQAYGSAWDKIAAAKKVHQANLVRSALLEQGRGFGGALFPIARTLVRLAAENGKPNTARLPEYSDAGRSSLELQLYSTAPIYPDLELAKLTDSLGYLAEQLGADDPLVQQVLAGKGPAARAAELLAGTKLKDVEERKKLAAGGQGAIDASTDTLIQLAKLVDPAARAVREVMEKQVTEVERQAYAQISKALFEIEGPSRYPDATFTLRLSYGVVKGYTSQGKTIPATTSLGGIFERSAEMEGRPPFDLPERWLKKRRSIQASVPFNFVSTHDIIGGNSGSPVVNRNGEFVGIIFDGNIESLVLGFAYEETQARALSVHSAGILESLRSVYGAKSLVDELLAGARR